MADHYRDLVKITVWTFIIKEAAFFDDFDIINIGNILATKNQQARINNVIEVNTGVYLHKT